MNDDGLDDVLVGAPRNDTAVGNDSGAAYVLYGSSDLADVRNLSNADVKLAGSGAGDRAGQSVSAAGAGDVTCDAVDDVLVGTLRNDTTAGNDSGAAYLVAGDESLSGTRNLSDADATFVGEAEDDRFGRSVGSAGDQNGDGVDDVVMGAPYNDSKAANAGAAYLFVGDCPAPDEEPATPTSTSTPTETETDTPTDTPTGTPTQTETTTTTQTPQEQLQATFFGCGNVEMTGPDEVFPLEVQLVTYNPGRNETTVGLPRQLDEGQRPGSPGGQLIGILTEEGDYVNPASTPKPRAAVARLGTTRLKGWPATHSSSSASPGPESPQSWEPSERRADRRFALLVWHGDALWKRPVGGPWLTPNTRRPSRNPAASYPARPVRS